MLKILAFGRPCWGPLFRETATSGDFFTGKTGSAGTDLALSKDDVLPPLRSCCSLCSCYGVQMA